MVVIPRGITPPRDVWTNRGQQREVGVNGSVINRRRFERFQVPAMYTAVRVRRMDESTFALEGHAYDISEAGVQFELDIPIAPGTPIAMEVSLPGHVLGMDFGPGRAIFAMGNIVWLDDFEPGPVRMALAITRYVRQGDRERLVRAFAQRRLARAA
jgi:hypothetical protein